MKKIIVLMVMAMLVVSASVMAADLEFNGGVSYNTFNGDVDVDMKSGLDYEYGYDYDIDSSIGFFVEGLYPLNDKVKIGGGYDYTASSFEMTPTKKIGAIELDSSTKYKGDLKLSAPYAKVVYSLQNNFDITAGLAYYKAEIDFDNNAWDSLDADGLGFLLGASYTYPVKENMNIVFGGDYRIAKLDMDVLEEDKEEIDSNEINLNGFRLSAALNYAF